MDVHLTVTEESGRVIVRMMRRMSFLDREIINWQGIQALLAALGVKVANVETELWLFSSMSDSSHRVWKSMEFNFSI